MIDDKKLAKLSRKLVSDDKDFLRTFKENVFMYLSQKELTLQELAEKSDISIDTLRSLLYKTPKDTRISVVIKLAKALKVSIDELIGANTLDKQTKESIAMCRNLPDNDLHLVRWFVRYLDKLNKNLEPNKRYVSVMEVDISNDGDLKLTSNYQKIDITELKEPEKSKIFFGVHLNCDNYMPNYSPDDVILIASNRPPKFNEHVLLRVGKCLYIAKQKIEGGRTKYFSIRDNKYWIDEENIDELIGYIVTTIRFDGSWFTVIF